MTKWQLRMQNILNHIEFKYLQWYTANKDEKNLKRLKENIYVLWPEWDTEEKERNKFLKAQREKKRRYKKRIKEMLECYETLYFVTLTGDNKKIKKNFDKTLKKKVKKYLDENCKDYIANGDYGSKNGRYHVHAVVAWNNTRKKFQYGFTDQSKLKNVEKTSKYLTKIVNHAGKPTVEKIWNKKKGMKEVEKLPWK